MQARELGRPGGGRLLAGDQLGDARAQDGVLLDDLGQLESQAETLDGVDAGNRRIGRRREAGADVAHVLLEAVEELGHVVDQDRIREGAGRA